MRHVALHPERCEKVNNRLKGLKPNKFSWPTCRLEELPEWEAAFASKGFIVRGYCREIVPGISQLVLEKTA